MKSSTRIKVLEESLCNQIAAGEVVERPASVVKELVENSLDSGADQIVVELETGGRKLIRVSDNGCGMSRQDTFLSLERHATSKIRCAEDLFALTSLGFRGEALASIASVSRLRLRSCASEDGLGQEILVEGGKVRRAEEVGMARGTLVEARNLFFNLPARRKFLRREQTELGHCADVVTKQALAHPDVNFKLLHNQRQMLNLRPEKGVAERTAALLGRSVLSDMLSLDKHDEEGGLRVHGLIGQPSLNRSSSAHIYTFINGRYIRDRVVQHAIMEGYRHLLMKGRFPVVVLFIEIASDGVDVNVHPTKHEVRFRDQTMVHGFITTSIQQQLKPTDWVVSQLDEISEKPTFSATPASEQPPLIAESPAPPYADTAISTFTPAQNGGNTVGPDTRYEEPLIQRSTSPTAVAPVGFFAGLRYLGQYHNSYILCQDGDDLLLIDQHAAHERIGFERLKKAFETRQVEQQTLLFPELLELDFRSAEAFSAHLDEIKRLGFEVEHFGGSSYVVKAVPQLLAQREVKELLTDIALELDQTGSHGALEIKLDEVLILMACHGVIRAHQALEVREARALLEQLDTVDYKAHCPHGRPVFQRIRLPEIERMFRRQ